MESPVARTLRAGDSPRLLGTALRKDLELQGAQPCVPSSHHLPCHGLLAVFLEGSVSPRGELGYLSPPGAWPDSPGKGKSSSMGKSCKKKFLFGQPSPTVPLGPGGPLCPQGCGDVTRGLSPTCCLVPFNPWLSPPLSTGDLPQAPPKGSPARGAPPKLGLPGAHLSLGFLTDDPNEPSWGSPADKAGRKRSLQASPGSEAVSPSCLLLPSLASGSRKSRLPGSRGQGCSSCPLLRGQLWPWQGLDEVAGTPHCPLDPSSAPLCAQTPQPEPSSAPLCGRVPSPVAAGASTMEPFSGQCWGRWTRKCSQGKRRFINSSCLPQATPSAPIPKSWSLLHGLSAPRLGEEPGTGT